MLRTVCGTFPKMTFHIDCNAGYTLDDLPFFKAIDGLGLAFIEQPLHYADVLDHAELARQIETPVCLDETITSVKAAEQAIQVGACRYINIKPGRTGGLSNSLAVHDLAQEAGIPVWVGGMLESAVGGAVLCRVGYAAQLHLSRRRVPFVSLLRAGLGYTAAGADTAANLPTAYRRLAYARPGAACQADGPAPNCGTPSLVGGHLYRGQLVSRCYTSLSCAQGSSSGSTWMLRDCAARQSRRSQVIN